MPSRFQRAVLAILPPGYRYERGGHSRLLDPDGEVVRTPDGKPVVIPGSPSDRGRALKNQRAQLRQAGIDI